MAKTIKMSPKCPKMWYINNKAEGFPEAATLHEAATLSQKFGGEIFQNSISPFRPAPSALRLLNRLYSGDITLCDLLFITEGGSR